MKKPRVYFDKDGDMTVVFGKNYNRKECLVTLVHDRGVTKQYNFFNEVIPRFEYHVANAHGDSGYSTTLDSYDKELLGTEYTLVKKPRRK